MAYSHPICRLGGWEGYEVRDAISWTRRLFSIDVDRW
mgnify:CR=1 FL=1